VVKVIRGITSKRSGSAIQLGGGLYLHPYSPKSGGSYKIAKSMKKKNAGMASKNKRKNKTVNKKQVSKN
jgi:hypothetical protein